MGARTTTNYLLVLDAAFKCTKSKSRHQTYRNLQQTHTLLISKTRVLSHPRNKLLFCRDVDIAMHVLYREGLPTCSVNSRMIFYLRQQVSAQMVMISSCSLTSFFVSELMASLLTGEDQSHAMSRTVWLKVPP
jgi:hypothetical protein